MESPSHVCGVSSSETGLYPLTVWDHVRKPVLILSWYTLESNDISVGWMFNFVIDQPFSSDWLVKTCYEFVWIGYRNLTSQRIAPFI